MNKEKEKKNTVAKPNRTVKCERNLRNGFMQCDSSIFKIGEFPANNNF